jgi:hypothetical protein
MAAFSNSLKRALASCDGHVAKIRLRTRSTRLLQMTCLQFVEIHYALR